MRNSRLTSPLALAFASYGVLAFAEAVLLVWAPLGARAQDVAVSATQIFATLLAAASLRAAGGQVPEGLRRSWRLMAAAWLSWGLGQGVWTILNERGPVPVPSVADICFLAVIPLMLAGVIGLAGLKSPVSWFRISLEAWAIAIALFGVTWHFVLLPIYSQSI